MPPKKKSNQQNGGIEKGQTRTRGGAGKSKKGSRKKSGKKPKPIIDWAADPYFDENRAMIYIEHTNECPIFLEKANEFEKFLRSKYPEKLFHSVLNDDGRIQARDGAFEICFSKTARTERVDLWSGIDKGPPRREKFPTTYEALLPDVDRILKKIYVVAKEEVEVSEWGDETNEENEMIGQTTIHDVTEEDTTT